MPKDLPKSLTIEESVTLMMTMKLQPRASGIYEELVDIYHDSELTVHEYEEAGVDSLDELEHLQRVVNIAKGRCDLAMQIKDCLEGMRGWAVGKGSGCPLDIALNESGSLKFTTDSVVSFAQAYFGITIPTRSPPPKSKRKYTSVYLDILDDVVDKEWGDGNPENTPTNDSIRAWLESKYPNIAFSNKLFDGFVKIVRPDEHRSSIEKLSIFKQSSK